MSYNSYQNGGGEGGSASGSSGGLSETEFQRLAQTIGTNIQKILQNGRNTFFTWLLGRCYCTRTFVVPMAR